MSFDSRISEIFEKYRDAHIALMSFVRDVERSFEDISRQHHELIGKLDAADEPPSSEEQTPTPEGSIRLELTETELTTIRKAMDLKTRILRRYPDLLVRSAFIYSVALFDGFLADAFCTVLSYRPEVMSTSKKQLSYDSIIRLHRSNELIQFMATREINEISYGSVRDQARYFQERFGVDLAQSGVDITHLTEIRATRNVLVHNNGIVNSVYLEAVPGSTYKLGDTLNLTTSDVAKKGGELLTVVKFVRDVIVEKFGTLGRDGKSMASTSSEGQ